MIQKSGHFEYDANLDEFYDYERYGLQHMDYQSGVFTDRGYIAYVGTVDLEELMAEGPVDQCSGNRRFRWEEWHDPTLYEPQREFCHCPAPVSRISERHY